jgi:hypothetical protein
VGERADEGVRAQLTSGQEQSATRDGRRADRSSPVPGSTGDRQMGPRGRAHLREAVPSDPDRAIEIGRPRSSTGGGVLTTTGGAALAHGSEVAGARAGAG